MPEQLAWENLRESYDRRVTALTKRLNFVWLVEEKKELLDRLCHVAGDPVTGPDLMVIIPLYNRELIGRRRAKNYAKV